jgi:phosphoenolpyruvate synthase/pyruvate phosphate dikinase
MKIYTRNDHTINRQNVGGKGFNLFQLQKKGHPVPNFVVIDQNELAQILPFDSLDTTDFSTIVNLIDQFEFPTSFYIILSAVFPKGQSSLFAVRSSSVQEDGENFSFAGQFETHLYVSWNDLGKFVKEIWKSNFSNRVQVYSKSNGVVHKMGIGVVVQEMIDARVSGVAFGIDPTTNIPNSKLICSVYGVGEGLVSGELNADTFRINQTAINPEIVLKENQAKRGVSGQIEYHGVPENQQNQPSLTDSEIKTICALLDQLTHEFNGLQDIEFALDGNQLYLLQTRPITSVHSTQNQLGTEKNNRIIWDNSNIVESYPGITSPLTFSYIRTAYKNVYLQLASLMGASKKTLKENELVFSQMLGYLNGRVYYNLLSWYKVLALFPGYSLNAEFMENMMGVKERFTLEKTKKSSKITASFRTLVMLTKIVINRFTIKRQSIEFRKEVDRSLAEIKQLNLSEMSAYAIKKRWIELDAELTPKWKAPLINDSFAMIYFGKLTKLIKKYKLSDQDNLQNDLLCGSKDIISVEPIHRSIAIATEIGENPALKTLFLESSPEDIWIKLTYENQAILIKIKRYIEEFGERCVGELKLETISYKQDPTLFISILKSFVKQGITTKSSTSNIDIELRVNAEKIVQEKLKNKPFKRYKFNSTLAKARYFVSNRENLRYERTKVFGVTREMFTAIGRQFEKNQVLVTHRDIFYLTKEEIFDFIDGTSVTKDLKGLVNFRKSEAEKFAAMEVPNERITTFETVNYGNDFYGTEKSASTNFDLKGQGCCPGIVRAKVRVVKHPSEVESLDGDILVTSSTDPGWVTLFPSSSGIIVERGSLLSHSAIVSREMGIPCIVGVTGLLKTLKTGDWIEMNGSTGEIKRHDGQ